MEICRKNAKNFVKSLKNICKKYLKNLELNFLRIELINSLVGKEVRCQRKNFNVFFQIYIR